MTTVICNEAGRVFGPCREVFRVLFAVSLVLVIASAGHAQTFDSTSDGSDGALTLTTTGEVIFDPVALGVDADGDHIFNFTTITIGTDTIVRLIPPFLDGPVHWLATGAVQIDGTVDLSGEAGQDAAEVQNDASRLKSVPGAGGFSGGLGGTFTSSRTSGEGPGGGLSSSNGGGGAGHNGSGAGSRGCGTFGTSRCANAGGEYGSAFIVPLMGGSGGAGGSFTGGGAGGGAILIASSTSIVVDGAILADGGNGGETTSRGGGGGSGGSVRLAAPIVSGAGTISTDFGRGGNLASSNNAGGSSAWGRVRVEAFQYLFTGTIVTGPMPPPTFPFGVFLPTEPPPRLRVVSLDGVAVANPTASLNFPDYEINTNAPVDIVVEARNIPLQSGEPLVPTVVVLQVVSENAPDQFINSTPLAGTLALSTATISVTIPPGNSRGYVTANWMQ